MKPIISVTHCPVYTVPSSVERRWTHLFTDHDGSVGLNATRFLMFFTELQLDIFFSFFAALPCPLSAHSVRRSLQVSTHAHTNTQDFCTLLSSPTRLLMFLCSATSGADWRRKTWCTSSRFCLWSKASFGWWGVSGRGLKWFDYCRSAVWPGE